METLTINAATFEQVRQWLERAGLPRYDTSNGAASIEELCTGPDACCFEVLHEGRQVGGYCLRIQDHRETRVAWLMACGGELQGHSLVQLILPHIEDQARAMGAHQLGITTKRMGLAQHLAGSLYLPSGVTMRKEL